MATPIFVFTRNELIYLLVLFLLGIIIGATLLNLFLSQQVDRLILEKKHLEVKVKEQEDQIKQLEENKYKYNYIRKLTINLDTDVNKHTQQVIKNKIRDLLSGLLGKEIKSIDPLLLWDVINDRYIPVEDKTFHLHLEIMVITEELQLYIKVKSTKKGEEPE